jgi:hypothetical protein
VPGLLGAYAIAGWGQRYSKFREERIEVPVDDDLSQRIKKE